MSAIVGLLTQTSLEPCDYAVPFSILACVCVGVRAFVCVACDYDQCIPCSNKTSWIYRTLIDYIYRILCKGIYFQWFCVFGLAYRQALVNR